MSGATRHGSPAQRPPDMHDHHGFSVSSHPITAHSTISSPYRTACKHDTRAHARAYSNPIRYPLAPPTPIHLLPALTPEDIHNTRTDANPILEPVTKQNTEGG